MVHSLSSVWLGGVVNLRIVLYEFTCVLVAQLDRAFGCGPKGRGFESLRERVNVFSINACYSRKITRLTI